MTIGPHGENLVFIVSQPRSGSTLLQRMLASHPRIHSTAEPWLMLHPLYALRDGGLIADYDADIAYHARQAFIAELPEGVATYQAEMRRMNIALYNHALPDDAHIFLDKTPRYYLILDELHTLFPQARFILLIRNPLAVLASLYTYYPDDPLGEIALHHADLLDAPRKILAAIHLGQHYAIHYEALVTTPEDALTPLCQWLDVPFDPTMITYGQGELPAWVLGDEQSVYAHQQPVQASLDKWRKLLENDSDFRQLSHEYITRLGQPTLAALGYDDVYTAVQPARGRSSSTLRETSTHDFARLYLLRRYRLHESSGARYPFWERVNLVIQVYGLRAGLRRIVAAALKSLTGKT